MKRQQWFKNKFYKNANNFLFKEVAFYLAVLFLI